MSNFKAGDLVICLKGDNRSSITQGKEYTVYGSGGGWIEIPNDVGGYTTYYSNSFKIVKPDYDLNTQPWFIKFDGEAELELVKQWLVENGYKGDLQTNYWSKEKELGNVGGFDEVGDYVVERRIFTVRSWYSGSKVPEIKLSFKTTVDKAEFPEVLSPSVKDKEIERIQNEMQKLQQDLEKLKGDK